MVNLWCFKKEKTSAVKGLRLGSIVIWGKGKNISWPAQLKSKGPAIAF